MKIDNIQDYRIHVNYEIFDKISYYLQDLITVLPKEVSYTYNRKLNLE